MSKLKNFPFPTSPEDGQVAVEDDIQCVFVEDSNTWRCTRFTPNKPNEDKSTVSKAPA